MTTVIKLRRDTALDWTAADPVLFEAEIGVETDTGKFKIGNGELKWSFLPYFLPEDQLTSGGGGGTGPAGPQGPQGIPGPEGAARRTRH